MLVVAGPSGSGKSTLLPVGELDFRGFNVDDRAARLHGSYRGIPPDLRRQAQRECEAFVESAIASSQSFAVETTLRSTAALTQAERARAHGFTTDLVYFCTEDVGENIERVIGRAWTGGHSAPAEEIRDIYAKSLTNLTAARVRFDTAELYDTSIRFAPPRLVVRLDHGTLITHGPTPPWVPAAWRP